MRVKAFWQGSQRLWNDTSTAARNSVGDNDLSRCLDAMFPFDLKMKPEYPAIRLDPQQLRPIPNGHREKFAKPIDVVRPDEPRDSLHGLISFRTVPRDIPGLEAQPLQP